MAHATTSIRIGAGPLLFSLLPFALLILLTRRAAAKQQQPGAWKIFIPVVALLVAAEVFGLFPASNAMGANSGPEIVTSLRSLVIGFAAVLLVLGNPGRRRHGFVRWLSSMAVIACASLITTFGVFGGFPMENPAMLIFLTVATVAGTAGIAITMRFLRRRFSYVRLAVYTPFVTLVCLYLGFLVVVGLTMLIIPSPPLRAELFLIIGVFSVAISIAMWLLLVPYLVLASRVAFYHERMMRLLGVEVKKDEPVPPPLPPQGAGVQPELQNVG